MYLPNEVVFIVYIVSIAVVLFFLSLTNVNIFITIDRADNNDYIKIRIHMLLGLIKFKFEIPYIDLLLNKKMRPGLKIWERFSSKRKKGQIQAKTLYGAKSFIETYEKVKEFLSAFKNTINYILSRISIHEFKWYTIIGTGEAGLTAISIGIMWAIVSNIIGLVSSKMSLKIPDINIAPNYSKRIFQVNFNCIIRIKIANIIIAGIRFILIFLKNTKYKKGGEGSERTSNTGINENYNG